MSTRTDSRQATRREFCAGPQRRDLRLATECPRCGARPGIRITPAQRRVFAALPAELVVIESYQCRRHGCGQWYSLSVAAFAKAA